MVVLWVRIDLLARVSGNVPLQFGTTADSHGTNGAGFGSSLQVAVEYVFVQLGESDLTNGAFLLALRTVLSRF